jgi:hypothetical protein
MRLIFLLVIVFATVVSAAQRPTGKPVVKAPPSTKNFPKFNFGKAASVEQEIVELGPPDFSAAIGAQPPLGLWDPLGLLKNADEERFDRLRNVELKHGRISMLAVAGHIATTSGMRLPGEISPGVTFASVRCLCRDSYFTMH